MFINGIFAYVEECIVVEGEKMEEMFWIKYYNEPNTVIDRFFFSWFGQSHIGFIAFGKIVKGMVKNS